MRFKTYISVTALFYTKLPPTLNILLTSLNPIRFILLLNAVM